MPLQSLINQAQALIEHPQPEFPIHIFHCREMQQLHRVHFYQPTLMLVLRGTKRISGPINQDCPQGSLILVPAGFEFPFANLPDDFYMALVLVFQPDDFPVRAIAESNIQLDIQPAPAPVVVLLEQFMSFSHSAMPGEVLQSRRKELAQLLSHFGLDTALKCPATPTWQTKVVNLIQTDISREWKLDDVCKALATSESNLRRRLQQENTSFREVLEDLRLTFGLGMIQTSHLPINQIALECGYQSASRFSERFKKRFHTTPSELRQAL